MGAAVFPACIVVIYLGGLFALSQAARRGIPAFETPAARSAIYALGCCVNWGFATGLEITGVSGMGSEIILIWLVPLLVFVTSPGIIRKMIDLKLQRGVTTVADFASAAYGKTLAVGAIIASCAFIAAIPLQATLLNAMCQSFSTLLGDQAPPNLPGPAQNFCIFLAFAMAVFTIAAGTHRPSNAGHQHGISLIVAAEVILRLLSLGILSSYVVWKMFGGVGGLASSVLLNRRAFDLLTAWPHISIVTLVVMGVTGILFVPSQYHMTVTENRDPKDAARVAWIYPALTIVSITFASPLLIHGLLTAPGTSIVRIEAYNLPLLSHSGLISAAGLIASYSAITSWMLVSTTTVASLVSNDIVIPASLHPLVRRKFRGDVNFAARVLTIRRIAILVSIFLSCCCCISLDLAALDTAMKLAIGLFAQAVPACALGMILKNPKAKSAINGIAAGLAAWAYIMVLPLFGAFEPFKHLIEEGPFGVAWLGPTSLFGAHLDSFSAGMIWSIGANLLAFKATSVWQKRELDPGISMPDLPSLQVPSGDAFFLQGGKVTLDALRNIIAQYLGRERTAYAFDEYLKSRSLRFDALREADSEDLLFSEKLLSTAIGKATALLVVTLFLQRQALDPKDSTGLGAAGGPAKEDKNRGGLLSGATLSPKHGMILYNPQLRLVAWNFEQLEKQAWKARFLELGLSMREVIDRAAKAGFFGGEEGEVDLDARYNALLDTSRIKRSIMITGQIFECRSLRLPDGFLSLHYIDITDEVRAEQKLEAENEILERRVRERTEELQQLNDDLIKAKAEAEEANISKTRFLAAASHDLLQPLNAARLYATSLKERIRARVPSDESLGLAVNVEDSLEAVEDILTALLDISHLDAGATKPEMAVFPVNEIFRQLQLEFEPAAREKGITVTFLASSLAIISDKRLLRRLLRNFVSNAIKYTPEGRVLAGVRRRGRNVHIEIWDTGIGIPKSKERSIFREFERLPEAMQTAPGVGLGLSIVERLSRLLGHEIQVRSKPGHGSVFTVIVPCAGIARAELVRFNTTANIQQGPIDGLTVAIVENDPDIISGMRALLTGWGCLVLTGESLEMLQAEVDHFKITPDVIIADYHLNKTDGLSVIAAVRKEYGTMHAVLITADRSPGLQNLLQSQDVRFLNKPIKPAVLRSLLSRWKWVKRAAE